MRNSQVRQAEVSGGGRDTRPTGERARLGSDNGASPDGFSDLINSWFEEGDRLSGTWPIQAD
jgi:hypothetical protein